MRPALRTLALLACLLLGPQMARAQDFRSEMIETNLREDGKPVRLEMLLHKPDGPGPFPVVLFNHGSTGIGNNPELFKAAWANRGIASYFVERGWMIVFPQRRGRGASEGLYDEGFERDRSRYSCVPALSLPGVDRAIEDLDAVVAHLRTRPDAQTGAMLIAGQSRGGILAITYAGERPDLFRGVINFVGGWMGDGCPEVAAINTATFRRGAAFKRPTLWLYGDLDRFYSLAHSRSNFDAFVSAGGTGQFKTYWVPGQNNGHGVLFYPSLWRNDLGAYLDTLK